MRTRAFGTTGFAVSEIGLGAWQLGCAGWNGPRDEAAHRVVDEALALGCTFIDTAPPYADGRSEELLGEVLEGRRDQVVLCTKFGHTPEGTTDYSADRIEASVEGSLRRLRTDHLDILLIHSPPRDLMNGTAPHYRVLERLKDAGVIRAYGVSLREGSCDELREVLDTTGSEAVEVRFNPLCQEPAPAIAEAGEKGVGIIVNVPLESGWLSGRYRADSTFDPVRSRWTRAEIARRAALVEEFEQALPAGTSTVHGALRFILAQPGVATVIPGAKSVEQVRDNVAGADRSLPAESVDAIRAFWETRLRDDPLPW
ncbi:aldo/keto reductase [Actinopolymorpha alba]|uniref:aldo/keto reductase n=1 Tax=Actinopolymorpha alba TaxID=533267 RepID=UPI00036FE0AE|nr:aldo/keto reductase [Actinopolymorpha alba]